MSDDELPEDFKSALEDNIKETREDFLKTYERLKEHFEYKNPIIDAALIDASSIISLNNVDSFLNSYPGLEDKIPKTRDMLKEAAKIRAAANIYAASFGKTMYEMANRQNEQMMMIVMGDGEDYSSGGQGGEGDN